MSNIFRSIKTNILFIFALRKMFPQNMMREKKNSNLWIYISHLQIVNCFELGQILENCCHNSPMCNFHLGKVQSSSLWDLSIAHHMSLIQPMLAILNAIESPNFQILSNQYTAALPCLFSIDIVVWYGEQASCIVYCILYDTMYIVYRKNISYISMFQHRFLVLLRIIFYS